MYEKPREHKEGHAMESTESKAVQRSLRDMEELVTVKQVATCAQVCKGTIYSLIKDGELHAIKLRGAIRLNRDEVCAYFGL